MKEPIIKEEKVSLIGATILCLMILAMTIPNLGRIARSYDAIPRFSIPRGFPSKIYYSWPDALFIVIAVLPLALVYLGVKRRSAIGALGWTWLIILFFLCISR